MGEWEREMHPMTRATEVGAQASAEGHRLNIRAYFGYGVCSKPPQAKSQKDKQKDAWIAVDTLVDKHKMRFPPPTLGKS